MYVSPPRVGVGAGYAQRSALLARLLDASTPPIVWIQAPAGSGKTAILVQWSAAAEIPVAWLSLDSTANDPARALQLLCGAFAHLTPNASSCTDLGDLDRAVDAFAAGVAASGVPMALVLDAGEALIPLVVLGAIELLVHKRPPNLRLLMASRRRLDLPLSRWRVRGDLLEIGPRELALSQQEIAESLADMVDPGAASFWAASVLRVTGGWAAGVGLSRRAIATRPVEAERSPDDALRQAIGRAASEFFTDEVLADQPPERVDFLLRTSILTDLTPVLCDELLGYSWSRRMLIEIERDGLFLMRISVEPPVWRYHDLFGSALRATFEERMGAPDVRQAHLDASDWFERFGLTDEAMAHALAARAFDRAHHLVISNAPALAQSGAIGQLSQWLAALAKTPAARSSDFIYWHCYVLMKTGDYPALFALLPILEELWQGTTDPLRVTRLASLRSTQHFHRAEFAPARTEAELAIATGAALAPSETAVARITLLGVLYHDGRVAEADRFQRGLSFTDAATEVTHRLYAGEIAFANCELGAAVALYQDALDTYAGHVSFAYLCFMLTLTDIYREWNDLDRSDAMAARADAYERTFLHDGSRWYVERMLALQRVSRGDWTGALEHANAMRRTITNVTSPDKHRYVRTFHALATTMIGDREAARSLLAHDPHPAGTTIWDIRSALIVAILSEAHGDAAGALRTLEQVQRRANQDGRLYDALRSGMAIAAVRARLGDRSAAMDSVARVVPLANRGGCRQVVLLHGPELLEVLGSMTRNAGARRLLASVTAASAATDSRSALTTIEPTTPRLTAREREVLQLAERGLSNAEIGTALGISVPTVKRHLTNAFHKLGARNRTEAAHQLRRRSVPAGALDQPL